MNHPVIMPKLMLGERLESLCRDMIEKGILYSEAMEHFERCFIMEMMERNGGNLSQTAASLGIHRNTLSKKINNRNRRKRQ